MVTTCIGHGGSGSWRGGRGTGNAGVQMGVVSSVLGVARVFVANWSIYNSKVLFRWWWKRAVEQILRKKGCELWSGWWKGKCNFVKVFHIIKCSLTWPSGRRLQVNRASFGPSEWIVFTWDCQVYPVETRVSPLWYPLRFIDPYQKRRVVHSFKCTTVVNNPANQLRGSISQWLQCLNQVETAGWISMSTMAYDTPSLNILAKFSNHNQNKGKKRLVATFCTDWPNNSSSMLLEFEVLNVIFWLVEWSPCPFLVCFHRLEVGNFLDSTPSWNRLNLYTAGKAVSSSSAPPGVCFFFAWEVWCV